MPKTSAEAMATRLPRLREAISGLQWGLERKPYIYPKLAGTELRCAVVGPLSDSGAHESFKVQVFFTYDGSVCEIQYLEAHPIG